MSDGFVVGLGKWGGARGGVGLSLTVSPLFKKKTKLYKYIYS